MTGPRPTDRAAGSAGVGSGPPSSRGKVRLAFYIASPMIGGTEKYLRDLLWGIDTRRYDMTLLTQTHPELETYLGVGDIPHLRHRRLRTVDEGSRVAGTVSSAGQTAPAPALGSGFSLRQAWHRVPGHGRLGSIASRPLRYAMLPLDIVAVRRELSTERYDILHIVNGGYPGSISAEAAAVAGAAAPDTVALMTVSNMAVERSRPRFVERSLDRAVKRSLARVIVPAANSGETLVTNRGFDQGIMVNIPLGVDIPEPSYGLRSAVREELGYAPEDHVVGTICRFVPVKRIETLVHALGALNRTGTPVKGLLVGDGPDRAGIQNLVDHLGLTEMIRFTGQSDRVYELLQAMDVFALSSSMEGLAYVVIEAMSQAKPVVATRVGGIVNSTVEGETALLVPPGDPEALAGAIRSVLEDPTLAERLGRSGRRRFIQEFSLSRMIRRHEELYEDVLRP